MASNAVIFGGVVAYPTEAVWGLGCDPFCQAAVERILALKRRHYRKGLILIASHLDQLKPFLMGLEPEKLALLKQSWPGPNTWLIPNNGVAPFWITGNQPTLAVRVTSHPVASALCETVGSPIVSTSANPQGLPAAKTALKVRCYFNAKLDAILPGALGGQDKPTQIRDIQTGKIVRPG